MKKGYYGQFGGRFVPQVFIPVLDELEAAFHSAIADESFTNDLTDLLRHFAGRETPLYRCRNLLDNEQVRLYLKREDLLHGGAHKTNQVLGQALLAKRMGKQRLIAETGAGQHGVATAIAGALLNLETCIYMGEIDCQRQANNVFRMELLGAKVIPVKSGSRTLKDAINEAMRDWSASYHHSHYLLGTAAGPHPFPLIVKHFQKIIGEECRRQILEAENRLPDQVIACVGGGSNAIGIFSGFLDDDVQLVGVEAAGHGLHTHQHGATLAKGEAGILHGSLSLILQSDGQINDTHSVSAGLDYPGIGPEHAYLQSSGRVTYQSVTDDEAVAAYRLLSQREGIIPALESAHAIAFALKQAELANAEQVIIVNLSGRGDKDLDTVRNYNEKEIEIHDYSLH